MVVVVVVVVVVVGLRYETTSFGCDDIVVCIWIYGIKRVQFSDKTVKNTDPRKNVNAYGVCASGVLGGATGDNGAIDSKSSDS